MFDILIKVEYVEESEEGDRSEEIGKTVANINAIICDNINRALLAEL